MVQVCLSLPWPFRAATGDCQGCNFNCATGEFYCTNCKCHCSDDRPHNEQRAARPYAYEDDSSPSAREDKTGIEVQGSYKYRCYHDQDDEGSYKYRRYHDQGDQDHPDHDDKSEGYRPTNACSYAGPKSCMCSPAVLKLNQDCDSVTYNPCENTLKCTDTVYARDYKA